MVLQTLREAVSDPTFGNMNESTDPDTVQIVLDFAFDAVTLIEGILEEGETVSKEVYEILTRCCASYPAPFLPTYELLFNLVCLGMTKCYVAGSPAFLSPAEDTDPWEQQWALNVLLTTLGFHYTDGTTLSVQQVGAYVHYRLAAEVALRGAELQTPLMCRLLIVTAAVSGRVWRHHESLTLT